MTAPGRLAAFGSMVTGAMLAVGGGFWPLGAREERPDPDALFRQLDANGDGRLTLDDAREGNRQFLQRLLAEAEKPADGALDREEFRKVMARRRGAAPPPEEETASPDEAPKPPLSRLFRMLDTNHDGRLSRAEWSALARLFNRLDTDSDGLLSPEEWRAAMAPAGDGPPPAEAPPPPRARQRTTVHRPEAARLDGLWRGWLVNGRGENPNAGQMQMELRIEGNQIVGREVGTHRTSGPLGGGTFQITGPGQIDALGTSGPQAGKRFLGIFQVEGDTLRYCSANVNQPRPRDFATAGPNYLMILHRVRE